MTRSCKGPITFSSTFSQNTYTFGNFCCNFSGSRWFQIARVKYWRLTHHAIASSLHRQFEIATKSHLKSPLRSIRVHETTCWYYNIDVLVGFTSASTDEQLLLPRERRNTSKTKTPAPQAGQLYLFCVRKICVSKASYMILMVLKQQQKCFLCPRTACLRGSPSELLMFVWPGRNFVPLISTYDWHICQSIL